VAVKLKSLWRCSGLDVSKELVAEKSGRVSVCFESNEKCVVLTERVG
jgi:hypothetical protein